MTELTSPQINVLDIIKYAPAYMRHFGTPGKRGGWLQHKYARCYDQRTVKALIRKGLVEQSEFGIRLKNFG